MTEPDVEVVIIGAGPGGIAAAHLLQRKDIHDFVIVERERRLRRHLARQPQTNAIASPKEQPA